MQCPSFPNCKPLELLWNTKVEFLPNGLPKIIHQTWKTDTVPEHWASSKERWQTLHPTWLYVFWTDQDIDAYVRLAKPTMYSTFRNLQWPIQRVDLFRYFVLHDFGGIYVDLDIRPVTSIDSYLETTFGDIFLVHSANTPSNFTNAFMMSTIRPNARRFWQSMMNHVKEWPKTWLEGTLASIRHLHIMMSTGPMALTSVANATNEAITVLPSSRWNPYDLAMAEDLSLQNAEGAIIQILPGSSWHAMDSKAISFLHIYKWPLILLASLYVIYKLIHEKILQQKVAALVRLLHRRKAIKHK